MTLKIKIPPIRQPQPSTSPVPQPQTVEAPMEDIPQSAYSKPQRSRKLPKRFLAEEHLAEEPERKAARTPTSSKTRHPSTSEPASESEMVSTVDDVEMAVVDQTESDGRRSEPAPNRAIKGQAKATKLKGKAPAATTRKKKRNVVVSDSEEDDNYMDTTLDVVAEDEEDEDYYSPEEKPTKPSKAANAANAKATASQPGKRKAKAEASESLDRKASAHSANKKKTRLPPKVDEAMIDIVGDSALEGSAKVENSSPVPVVQDSPTIIPKRPKLPTIKKTKLPTSAGVSTPLSANPSSAKTSLELGLNTKPNHGEIRKTMINQTDIDLSNKSIYQEIFLKMTGDSGTPRRTKEEERRKELNRLRDEAKAKRLAEAQNSFDLQAQYDKISRFEDKLRAERSSALWPNFLGAKWREEYEREKRRQKELQWQETTPYDGREEGEVS